MKALFLNLCAWAVCCSGGLVAAPAGLTSEKVLELDGRVLKGLVLEASKATSIYASKKGGQRIGVFPAETQVQLVAMTERAYKVRGKARHGMVAGWISPKNLISNDEDFVNNLKAFYERTWALKELIEAKEVAIGMTTQEVSQSLGEPTKREDKVTKEGRSGSWEYSRSEEQKHYIYRADRKTGQVYRQYSHSTVEVRERLTVEFEHNLVTAITRLKDDSKQDVRIVVPPVIFRFHL